MSHEADLEALAAKYAAHPTGSVVFYGSSSIRLWPALSRSFSGVSIENWGFGGGTLRECADFYARFVAPREPQFLIVYAGDNDLFLGASPDEVWSALRDLLDQSGEIPLAFLSLKPSPARENLRPQIEEANEWCRREIAGRPNAQWIEIFEPMLDEQNSPRSELFLADELHLSRAGYELWNEIVAREVDVLHAPDGA